MISPQAALQFIAGIAEEDPDDRALIECPVKWRRAVNEDICWPQDCEPVVQYFCGPHKEYAVKGWDIRFGPAHVAYFDLCEVCVEHYTFIRKPAIKNYQCWLKERARGFCTRNTTKNSYSNLPRGKCECECECETAGEERVNAFLKIRCYVPFISMSTAFVLSGEKVYTFGRTSRLALKIDWPW